MPRQRYVRFICERLNEHSRQASGVIAEAHALLRGGELSVEEEAVVSESIAWFDEHLRGPRDWSKNCKWHESEGMIPWVEPHLMDNPRVVYWLRAEANEHVRKMRTLAQLLAVHGVLTRMVWTETPGTHVYRDEHQLGAIPFRKGRR